MPSFISFGEGNCLLLSSSHFLLDLPGPPFFPWARAKDGTSNQGGTPGASPSHFGKSPSPQLFSPARPHAEASPVSLNLADDRFRAQRQSARHSSARKEEKMQRRFMTNSRGGSLTMATRLYEGRAQIESLRWRGLAECLVVWHPADPRLVRAHGPTALMV